METANTNSTNSKEKKWISLTSVMSCISVVFLHTNGCFWTFSRDRYWVTANIIEGVFYFAVPCFFMISGATLIDYRERYSTSVYFEKRVRKTVVPFLVWSLLGLLFRVVLSEISLQEIDFQYLWNGIVGTTIIPIYWFFPVLFGVYLSIPVLASVEKKARKDVFTYAVIASFVLGGVMPLLCNTILSGFTWNINIGAAAGYLFYILTGYLISEHEISSKNRKVFYTFAIIGLLIHIIGTYTLSLQAGEVVSTYKGYTNAPCILYSVGIFIWLRYNGNAIMTNKLVRKIISFISPHTLSIYLLQYFIYTLLVRGFDVDTRSIIYRLGAPFIIVPVASICSLIVKKIPFLKAILP